MKVQHVSRDTPLITRSSKLYLQPLVYIPMWWPAVVKAEWEKRTQTSGLTIKFGNNKFYYKAESCWYFY